MVHESVNTQVDVKGFNPGLVYVNGYKINFIIFGVQFPQATVLLFSGSYCLARKSWTLLYMH